MSPQRLWKAITIGTLVLVPAYWALLVGVVADASDDRAGAPNAAAAIAVGVALVPFVFVALAFVSHHPRASTAVLRAMGTALLVGLPVSVLALDAVTGIVAGVGAGGAVALRNDADTWRPRALGVLVAALYTFVLVRVAGDLALLSVPVFPLTALGLADHLSTWRQATLEAR